MGGGLVDYRVLYVGLGRENETNLVTDIDIDRYEALLASPKYTSVEGYNSNTRFTRIGKSYIADGAKLFMNSDFSYDSAYLKCKKQQDGLWTFCVSDYEGYEYKEYALALLIGIKPSTKTTEVSTMTVTNDQPISAGNLKAALDGLTGGRS